MRILLAGWQGQIARAFIEAVPSCPDIRGFAVGRPALDICEARAIERAMTDMGPDVVINAAAYTAVDKAESEPERAFALNRDGARMLATAAARRGIPIIHLSTDYVFDGLKPTPYVETDATSPATVYGKSKLEGEQAVAAANAHHIILRTAWLFGPHGRNFARTMLQHAARPEVEVVDDQIGTPTYAPHLAQALIEVARFITSRRAEVRWGTYHCAGTGSVTWCGLAREIFAHAAEAGSASPRVTAIKSVNYPTAAKRPANSQLDSTLLQHTFGVGLPAWRTGVADCVRRLAVGPA